MIKIRQNAPFNIKQWETIVIWRTVSQIFVVYSNLGIEGAIVLKIITKFVTLRPLSHLTTTKLPKVKNHQKLSNLHGGPKSPIYQIAKDIRLNFMTLKYPKIPENIKRNKDSPK